MDRPFTSASSLDLDVLRTVKRLLSAENSKQEGQMGRAGRKKQTGPLKRLLHQSKLGDACQGNGGEDGANPTNQRGAGIPRFLPGEAGKVLEGNSNSGGMQAWGLEGRS